MPPGTPVQVRLPDEELRALDSYRREKLNPPSRSRALRELANIALLGGSVVSPNSRATESGHQVGARSK
jgi:hypothetical protein